MLAHMCRRLLFVALAILTFSLPLTTFEIVRPPWEFGLAADAALVLWTFLTFGLYLGAALRLSGRRVAPALLLVPVWNISGISTDLLRDAQSQNVR